MYVSWHTPISTVAISYFPIFSQGLPTRTFGVVNVLFSFSFSLVDLYSFILSLPSSSLKLRTSPWCWRLPDMLWYPWAIPHHPTCVLLSVSDSSLDIISTFFFFEIPNLVGGSEIGGSFLFLFVWRCWVCWGGLGAVPFVHMWGCPRAGLSFLTWGTLLML